MAATSASQEGNNKNNTVLDFSNSTTKNCDKKSLLSNMSDDQVDKLNDGDTVMEEGENNNEKHGKVSKIYKDFWIHF